jgi:hypothetical protein
VPVAGNQTDPSSPYYNAQGIMGFPNPGIASSSINGWSSQWSSLVSAATRFVEPRGVAYVGNPITMVWVADSTVGLYCFQSIAGSWVTLGPFAAPGESVYQGVSLSSDNTVVYVAGGAGIYAFSNATMSFFNGGAPVVAAPSTGAGLAAAFRGLALSVATPLPTPTATMSPTMSVTPSASLSVGATASSTETATPTLSATTTETGTGSNTPSSSRTASNTPSSSRTPSDTPSSTQTPSNTPSPSATGTATQTPAHYLTYGSTLAVRLGTGATAPTATTLVPMYIEEWMLPTTPGAAATLLQVLPLPGTAIPVSATTAQGFLSRAMDGTHLVASCYTNAAGGGKPVAGQLLQVCSSRRHAAAAVLLPVDRAHRCQSRPLLPLLC